MHECMINYTSAEMSADQLEAQFREDERAGMMVATTEGAVKQEFGEGQLLIAAMGALVKPSGQIRPLHDGTHGIRLNNSIKVLDRLEHPGPADIVEVVAPPSACAPTSPWPTGGQRSAGRIGPSSDANPGLTLSWFG